MPKLKKTHPWDRAAAAPLTRRNFAFGDEEPLDPGVNFFVLALEAMGAKTRFSCEGHPGGFYVAFEAPYSLALEIKSAGFFSVQIEGQDCWSIRKSDNTIDGEPYTEDTKVKVLRWATDAWLRVFKNRLASLECLQPEAPGRRTRVSKAKSKA